MEVISRDETTAQIDPLRFCQWLLKEVKARGVKIHQPATATAIVKDSEDVLRGVRISEGGDAELEAECEIPSNDIYVSTSADHLPQYRVRASS
jgi:glycine/D-amino acid oxidase-like deaminating enzyme